MTPPSLSLEAFLALPWTDSYRVKLQAHAAQPDVQALAAWDNAGRLSCSAYTEEPDAYPDKTVAVWRRTFPQTQEAVKSKTMQALDRVLQDGLTPFAAAKEAGINASAVYRALARQQNKPLCPCCGQVVRDGFTVDRSVLRDPSDAPAGA